MNSMAMRRISSVSDPDTWHTLAKSICEGVHSILKTVSYQFFTSLKARSLRLFVTTKMELNAIAPAAIIGLR